MIFKDFAVKWLGSKSKLKVVFYFLSGNGPTGERELARALGLSHVAVNKILKDMSSVNFLRSARIGNVNVWSLNEKSYACNRAKDLQLLAKTPALLDLKKNLEADFGSYSYIKRVVLFGSIAEGTEKESSDIDLFILVDKEASKKSILKAVFGVSDRYKDLYGNRISLLILTEKETKNNKGLMENVGRGIVII